MKYKNPDRFFLIFLCTILVTRMFLFLFRLHSPVIGEFPLHHYMYGFLLIVIGLARRSLPAYAIGWGLIVDELMMFPLQAKDWHDYFSPAFAAGTTLFSAIVFYFRSHIVYPITEGQNTRPL
ncbi:hypothetical protein HY970_01160 [Candidatus Kaiserbacteria bacterium]|nr:hypothetical protein [Candidatus Kaiserbacteria bacterium]